MHPINRQSLFLKNLLFVRLGKFKCKEIILGGDFNLVLNIGPAKNLKTVQCEGELNEEMADVGKEIDGNSANTDEQQAGEA